MATDTTRVHPAEAPGIEGHSIDFIPEDERHGKPRALFFVWWSSNMQMTTVLTGVIAAALGLTFLWALLAILIGLLVGGVVMCLHSWQGPRLGIPQILQSRAQFGFVGAILPAAVAIFMYVGFFATSNLLGGEGITGAIPGIPLSVGITRTQLPAGSSGSATSPRCSIERALVATSGRPPAALTMANEGIERTN